jgi:hypothetical protein
MCPTSYHAECARELGRCALLGCPGDVRSPALRALLELRLELITVRRGLLIFVALPAVLTLLWWIFLAETPAGPDSIMWSPF